MGQAFGAEEKQFMKKKTVKYTNEALGKLEIIPDFLPAPQNLVLKEETEKVTITLSKRSIDFFKHEAKENHTQYQKMIRVLLDQYALYYQQHHEKRI